MTYFLRHGERAPSHRSAANNSHSAPASPNTHINVTPNVFMERSLLFLSAERLTNACEKFARGCV